jgi:drug/metabolite transporter (DMT)-like permease
MRSIGLRTRMMSVQQTSSRGIIFLVFAVAFWGSSASLAKYLFMTRYDPLIISQTRSSLSFLLLAGYFTLLDRSVFRLRLGDFYKFALIGVIGVACTNFTYYFTVKESTVATAILIQNLAPVFVMVYAVAISKEEELNGIRVISLVLAVAGCYLAVSGGSLADIRLSGWALLTGPASMLSYAFMLVASKHVLRSYSVWTMLVNALGFATLFWLVVNPPWAIAAKGYGAEDWSVFLLFAVVSILIPYVFFTKGLKLLEATTAGIVTTLEPIIAIIVAYLALGEALNLIQMVGALAVVGAVLLLQLRRDQFSRILRRRVRAE